MVNDPIGDLLIQIKNASMAGIRSIELPYSKAKMAVSEVLVKTGYLVACSKQGDLPHAVLQISLAYDGKEPVLTGVKRVSKPGMRWYVGKKEIPLVMGGMGTAIVSTPSGIMTGQEARKNGLGGELLCEVW